MRFSGWKVAYEGAIDEGDALDRWLVKRWVSILGDRLEVRRNIIFDNGEFRPIEADEIKDGVRGEKTEDLWIVQNNDGTEEFYSTQQEALDAAKDVLKTKYSDEQIQSARESIETDEWVTEA